MDRKGPQVNMVLDASVAVSWLIKRPTAIEADRAKRVARETLKTETLVPMIWYAEISNALLVAERKKVIVWARIVDYFERLEAMPIRADNVLPLTRREQVMALARQYGLSAYDACYLELALRKEAVLATFDVKLATAMKNAGGKVFE